LIFFTFLTDSKPVSVSVESLNPTHEDLFPTDNFSAQISFADGSICSLIYTSLGNIRLGKERLEIFFDSKSIVMENYTKLSGFGLPKSFDEYVKTPDKGHSNLINQFFCELNKKNFVPPINFERLDIVANLTLVIDQLACQSGGQKNL